MNKMTAAVTLAAVLLLGGCGYKSAPYYEKDSPKEASVGAV